MYVRMKVLDASVVVVVVAAAAADIAVFVAVIGCLPTGHCLAMNEECVHLCPCRYSVADDRYFVPPDLGYVVPIFVKLSTDSLDSFVEH